MAQATAIYLVAGPDFGRREQAIRTIRDAVEKRMGGGSEAGASAIEYSSYYADDLPVGELINRLYNRTLFHTHLLAVYRNVDALRGAGMHGQLRKYIATPSEQATLILVSENASLKTAWAKAIPKSQTTVCWQPFENEINAAIGKLFHIHGKRIAPDLVAQIGDLCENDSHLAEQLCRQIIYFFHQQQEITADLLFEFVDQQQASSIFQLTDALLARNTKETITILHRLHAEHFSANHIAGFVNGQVQKLWRISYLMANGLSSNEAMKKNGVVWKRQMQSFQRGLSAFPLAELSRLITQHKDLEVEIRELPEQYAYLLLTRLIVQVCAGLSSPLVPVSRPRVVW